MKKIYLSLILFVFVANSIQAQTATAPLQGDGTFGNPYEIASLNNLYWIAASSDRWDDHYIQTASIDASSTSTWFSGKGWLPIGNSTTRFTGTYDGQNYAVDNLFMNRVGFSDPSYVGMFGYVNGSGTIKNLIVTNLNFTGKNDIGGIVGFNNSVIANCHSTGTISGRTRTGGLVGYNSSGGIIEDSYSSCTITGSSYEYHGGLSGRNDGAISRSYATGSVVGKNYIGGLVGYNTATVLFGYSTSDVTGENNIGGFVGFNSGSISYSYADIGGTDNVSSTIASGYGYIGGFVGENTSSGNISNCYATVNLVSLKDNVYGGGFVSINNGTISDCYCYSSVLLDETLNETVASGFVVVNNSSGAITNSYSRGSVNAVVVAGFAGLNDGGSISNCFWDGSTFGSIGSAGGTENTLTEMRTITTYTNAGWAFECDTWGINGSSNDQCPFLLWQNDYGFQPNDCNYWTGTSSTAWATSGNWSSGVPGSTDNVLIPNKANDPVVSTTVTVNQIQVGSGANFTISSGGDFTFTESLVNSGNIIVDAGGKLNATGTLENLSGTDGLLIKSTSSGTGSIILSTANVPATVQRYITPSSSAVLFHIASTPVSGQSISNFIYNNKSVIAYSSSGKVYAMKPYKSDGTGWDTNYSGTETTEVSPATAYSIGIKLNATTLEFKGDLVTTNQSKTIIGTGTGFGWNGIGNPFASSLNAKADVNSFLTKYGAQLDASYQALYVWDPSTSQYTVINGTTGQSYLASGQGFIVKGKSGGGTVIFETGMRAHQSPTFYKSSKAIEDWSKIDLQVENSLSKVITTNFAFNSEMTTGLDVGYDAGHLSDKDSYRIFSRMPIEGEDLNLMVQALPNDWNEAKVIPLGLQFDDGGEITFSATLTTIPENVNIQIEDRQENVFTDLKSGNYTVTIPAGADSLGRFYLHVEKEALVVNMVTADGLSYCEGQDISVTFNASPLGGTYRWFNGDELIPDATLESYTATSEGIYTVEVTYDGSTMLSDPQVILVNELPTITVPNDFSICHGESATITATGNANSYLWNKDVINGEDFYPTETQTYTVTATIDATGCQASDELTVTVNQLPELNVPDDSDICLGEDLMLIATGNANTYIWNNGVINAQYFTPTETLIYTVVATNTSTGCKSEDEVTVTVNPNPEIALVPESVEISTQGQQLFDAGEGYASYLWFDESTEQTYLFVGSEWEIGSYDVWVEVTNEFGCASRDTAIVVLGTTSIEQNDWTMKLYPNPSKGEINLNLNGLTSSEINVSIVNINGQIVYQKDFSNFNGELREIINLKDKAKGVHIINISDGINKITRRIVIE